MKKSDDCLNRTQPSAWFGRSSVSLKYYIAYSLIKYYLVAQKVKNII